MARASVGQQLVRPTIEIDRRRIAARGKLAQRIDALAGSAEASELKAIVELIEACEAMWGPLGKDPNVLGGKG
jgi:hypothetical protein